MSSSIPDPIPDDATPEQLRHIANYWRLEAQGYAVRWNLAMQYGDNLKAENARLRKAGDAVIEKLAEAYAGEPSDFDHAHVFKGWIEAKGEQPNK